MQEIYPSLGDKIRQLRLDAKLKQLDLARQLGVAQYELSRIESNQITLNQKMIDDCCVVFGLTLEEMLSDISTEYLHNNLQHINFKVSTANHSMDKHCSSIFSAQINTYCALIGLLLFMLGQQAVLFDHVYYRCKPIININNQEIVSRDCNQKEFLEPLDKTFTTIEPRLMPSTLLIDNTVSYRFNKWNLLMMSIGLLLGLIGLLLSIQKKYR